MNAPATTAAGAGCLHADCDGEPHARGLCYVHYSKWYRGTHRKPCRHCAEPSAYRGLCAAHNAERQARQQTSVEKREARAAIIAARAELAGSKVRVTLHATLAARVKESALERGTTVDLFVRDVLEVHYAEQRKQLRVERADPWRRTDSLFAATTGGRNA